MRKERKTRRSILTIIGGVILIWNIYWFVRVRVLNDYAFISNVILMNVGFIILIAYFSAISFLIVKWLKKRK